MITTLRSRQLALSLADSLVERQLVVCAQPSAIESVSTWDGPLQQEQEARLTLKASESHDDQEADGAQAGS